MHHNVPLIMTLAAALGLALIMGFIALRLKLPALVGYLFAGVLIGPFTPGFVADANIAAELSEIGVMLLMFGVGLHFSLEDLLRVRRVALPGAVLQMAVATGLGVLLAWAWDWPLGSALVFGLCLSVASTVVLLRALEAANVLDSLNGRIAVGWLVVEDLAMVLVLVLLPPLAGSLGGKEVADAAGGDSLAWTLFATLAKVSAFVGLMLIVGKRVFPRVLWHVARTGSRELFTLCTIAAAVSIAVGAGILFGVSFALGAFFAGMVLRESEFSHRAADESLPLREAFAVLFFVSVGMLFDPAVLLSHPLEVLGVVAIIVVGKSLAAAGLVLILRYPLNTALVVAVSLAQIGEFSFILAGLGVSLGLMPPEGQSLILAGALISIAINPLLFTLIEPMQKLLRVSPAVAQTLESPEHPLGRLPDATERHLLEGQVVLVGYGRIGRRVHEMLQAGGIPCVVVEHNREWVEELRGRGVAAVSGDGTDPMVLVQAHVAKARMMVLATPDIFEDQVMITTARTLNPEIEVVVLTHSEDEAALLRENDAARVFLGDLELADSMSRHVLKRFGRAEPVAAPVPLAASGS